MPAVNQQVPALANATSANFIIAMMAQHRASIEADATGSLLDGPLVTLATQFIAQVCELHGLTEPKPVSRETPPPPLDPEAQT